MLPKLRYTGALPHYKSSENMVSKSQIINIYNALVESHLRYADIIWGNLSNSRNESLQHPQERAISIINTATIKDNRSRKLQIVEQLLDFD